MVSRAVRVMVGAAACVCGMSGAAWADELFSTLGEPLSEVAHEVDARIEDGVATYVVRRTFHNAGGRHDEAVLSLRLPPGAAATGLRIRAQDRWYDGELMEAERASQLYQELTGMGPHTPRDPALLSWEWSDALMLRVFPVPPGGIATVEYTLKAPTSYDQGRYSIWYPQPVEGSKMAQVTVRLTPPVGLEVQLDGRSFPASASIPLSQLEEHEGCQAAREAIGADGSCALSEVEIPAGVSGGAVRLKAQIKHTWRGDLIVALRSPSGTWATLAANEGGTDNDLALDKELPLPYGEPVEGVWQLVVSDTLGRDVGVLESWSLEVGKRAYASAQVPQVIPDAPDAGGAEMTMMSVAAPRIDGATGRLGRVVAGAHQFTNMEIEIAPRLSELPKEAAVVFVIDASRSIGEHGVKGQLDAARAYMRHVPDARAQVVVVRRRAEALFEAFVPAEELEARLEQALLDGKLEVGNGSAWDAGLSLAAQLLGKERGPQRLVTSSDLLMRPALTATMAEDALAGLRKDAVVHVIEPRFNSSEPGFERDDAAVWAPLATKRNGIFVRLDGLGHEEPHKGLAGVMLGLVRPLQIDFLSIEGLEEALEEGRESIREGQGLRYHGWVKAAPLKIVVRGKLWSAPFSKTLRVTDAASRLAAAYIFSLDEHDRLSREEQLKVAFYGRVVSPVTSYLAIEPGVRPSTAGIDRLSGRGFGAGGMGRVAFGEAGGARIAPDAQQIFARVWEACDGDAKKRGPIEITAHTTRREIVDVVPAQAADPLVTCLVEGMWQVELPDHISWRERDVLVVRW